ncbi:MAG: MmcQ/YjbR family DNA-binding protein [Vulcanimicrobiaceae bacterium]
MASWRDVRRVVAALPGTSEGTSASGRLWWVVRGKSIAWERPLRKSDLAELGERAPNGPILGVRTADLEMKEALLGRDCEVYFTTRHFDGYPAVLVQLRNISVNELKDLILEAWLVRAPKRMADAYLQSRKSAALRPAPARRKRRP